MFDPTRIYNAWFALSLQATRLAWEAQSVVALRLMRIASESARGRRSETHRMVAEKIAALTEAQAAAAIAAVGGRRRPSRGKEGIGRLQEARSPQQKETCAQILGSSPRLFGPPERSAKRMAHEIIRGMHA
jgi:hypothetical protein